MLIRDADLLGQDSSKADRPRWAEIEIYGTPEGYFAVVIGQTEVHGEEPIYSIYIANEAGKLLKLLLRGTPGSKFLPAYVVRAIKQASLRDPAITDALRQFEEAAAWFRAA